MNLFRLRGGVNENGPYRLMYLSSWLQLVELFEKVGGGLPRGLGFEVSRASAIPSYPALSYSCLRIRCKLSTIAPAPCLPACCCDLCSLFLRKI